MKALIQTGSSGRVPVPPEKRFLINITVVALIGAFSLCAHGNTNSWGQVLYTRYQESKVYYAPTTSAVVLKTLSANETVKADRKEGKWYAIFKPSETVCSITNVVGYMEADDLFTTPLPPGPIKGGVGNAPPVMASVEGLRPIPILIRSTNELIRASTGTSFWESLFGASQRSPTSDKERYDNYINWQVEKAKTQMEREAFKRQVQQDTLRKLMEQQ